MFVKAPAECSEGGVTRGRLMRSSAATEMQSACRQYLSGIGGCFQFSKRILKMRANVGRGAEFCAEESYYLRSGSVPVAEDVAIKFFAVDRTKIVGHQTLVLRRPWGGPSLLLYSYIFLSDINWGHDISVIRHPEVK